MKTFYFSICLFIVSILNVSAKHPSIGGYNVYYGHLHNHTSYSDGKGTPKQAYSYARDTAHLDFFGLADHCFLLKPEEYDDIKTQANTQNKDGKFTTFYGFESTASDVYGHVAVVNADDYCRYKKEIFTFADLIKWINERPDCIAFFNHPGDYDKKGTEFSHFNATPCDHFVGMEQWNKKVPFKKYYYNDGYDKGDNRNYYEEANAKGWRIGASGSGDDHNSTWGTAQPYRMAILSKKLTRAALLDAMKQRRFYSTLDKNLALSFKINEAEMGSIIRKEGTYKVQLKASDSDMESFTEVLIIDKNHKTVFSGNPDKPDVCLSTTLQTHKGDFFYVKVKQADGDEAISSPIFIGR